MGAAASAFMVAIKTVCVLLASVCVVRAFEQARSDQIVAEELVGAPWPFKDRDGVVFCYKVFPFTYIQFKSDWDDDWGFLLDRNGMSQAFERTFNGDYLRDDLTTEELYVGIRAVHELVREKCGPPYADEPGDNTE